MPTDPTTMRCAKREINRGVAWTTEEDQRLAQVIEVHGPKRWRYVAAKSGLNRCGKSCRLRWMNYLRPNIKRGNISDQEEDLIVRLHKLLGNRWSLIAGRLPGRTDNEIKNSWNSHLSKKLKQNEKQNESSTSMHIVDVNVEKNKSPAMDATTRGTNSEEGSSMRDNELEFECGGTDEFFGFQFNQAPPDLEWISKFLELDETSFNNLRKF